jgi:hypothetical protein
MIEIHGYAIVSGDDRIADAAGRTPDALRNDADWAYFQRELDRADLTVLGRLGHEANPNRMNRQRLVLSSQADGVERGADAWWWNPSRLDWPAAARRILPRGGRVAVPGGRQVFDLFLTIGYDVFHLSRAEGVRVPGGVPLFSMVDEGRSAEGMLAAHGLRPDPPRLLDAAAKVSLTIWRRASAASAAATSGDAER